MSQEVKVYYTSWGKVRTVSMRTWTIPFITKADFDQALAAKDAQIALLEKKLEKCKEQRNLFIGDQYEPRSHAQEVIREEDLELDSITVEKGE